MLRYDFYLRFFGKGCFSFSVVRGRPKTCRWTYHSFGTSSQILPQPDVFVLSSVKLVQNNIEDLSSTIAFMVFFLPDKVQGRILQVTCQCATVLFFSEIATASQNWGQSDLKCQSRLHKKYRGSCFMISPLKYYSWSSSLASTTSRKKPMAFGFCLYVEQADRWWSSEP